MNKFAIHGDKVGMRYEMIFLSSMCSLALKKNDFFYLRYKYAISFESWTIISSSIVRKFPGSILKFILKIPEEWEYG